MLINDNVVIIMNLMIIDNDNEMSQGQPLTLISWLSFIMNGWLFLVNNGCEKQWFWVNINDVLIDY